MQVPDIDPAMSSFPDWNRTRRHSSSSSSSDSNSSGKWSVTAVVGMLPLINTPEDDNMKRGAWFELHRVSSVVLLMQAPSCSQQNFATCVLRALKTYDGWVSHIRLWKP
jgi:hypothetical protein